MIETVSGGCIHIEIDGEEGSTTAAFTFPTPSEPALLGVLVSKLAQGIEILIPVEELDEDEEDDD
jgi:hypothetical protein